jgi:ATP-dependent exoDNAse (exonuclease V) beta subunit
LKNPPNLLFDRSYGMSFKPDKFEDEEDSQWYQMCNWYSREMDIAERKRLLYVAMTRARERLFVLLDLGARNDVSFNSWLKEVLNAESAHEAADDSKKESMFLKPEDFQDVRPLANSIDEISLAELDLSMLDVVDQPELETSFKGNWQQVLRVSLSAKQSPFIEPTILGILFHKAMEKLNSIDEKDYARSVENLAMQMGIVEKNLRSLAVSTVCSWLELYKNSNLLPLQESAARQFHEYVYVFDGREKRVDLLCM